MSPRKAMVMRAFRVPMDLWAKADAIARMRDEAVSDILRAALVRYVAKYGKELPDE